MTLLILEQRQGVAEMFVRVFEATGDFAEACTAGSVRDALGMMRGRSFQAVVANIDTVSSDLSLLASESIVRSREVRLIMVGDTITDTRLEQLLRLPLGGIHAMEDPLDSLVACCRSISREPPLPCLSPSIQDRVTYERRRNGYAVKHRSVFASLTLRQIDVLKRIAEGHSAKEIADQMYLSPRAVESHKYRIMRRLGIRDRVQLCRYLIREGLVQP